MCMMILKNNDEMREGPFNYKYRNLIVIKILYTWPNEAIGNNTTVLLPVECNQC